MKASSYINCLFFVVTLIIATACNDSKQQDILNKNIQDDLKFKEPIEKLNTRIYEMEKRIVWLEMQISSLEQKIAKTADKPKIKQQNYYTVQYGDTLFGIAKKFDISIKDIRRLNSLSSNDQIYVGQKLNIVESLR